MGGNSLFGVLARALTPGTRYRHFKGEVYTIAMIATHTENGECLVLYTDGSEMWARPLLRFFEMVETEGGRTVPRFVQLTEEHHGS